MQEVTPPCCRCSKGWRGGGASVLAPVELLQVGAKSFCSRAGAYWHESNVLDDSIAARTAGNFQHGARQS